MQRFVANLVFVFDTQQCYASLPGQMRSDGQFMGKDYPSDVRAKVTDIHRKYNFDHPYPILQEDHDYDSDYVKDENDDGGEFQAQEQYDYLRHEIAKYEAEVARLREKLKDPERRFRETEAAEARAEAASKAADTSFDKAKKDADIYQDRVDELKGIVTDAQKEADKEMNELAECRKELQLSKKNLEKQLTQHRTKEESYTRKVAGVAAAQDAAEDAADTAVTDSEANENAAEGAVAAAKADVQRAQAAYDAALAKVKKTEALLEEAAAKLARFRHDEDSNGGVYYVNNLADQKAAAWRGPLALPCIAALLGALLVGS